MVCIFVAVSMRMPPALIGFGGGRGLGGGSRLGACLTTADHEHPFRVTVHPFLRLRELSNTPFPTRNKPFFHKKKEVQM